MKKLFYISCLLLMLAINAISQGLNYEKGYNTDYNQKPGDIVCVDEYTYLGIQKNITASFHTLCFLYKLDTTGHTVWNKIINPTMSEYSDIDQMIATKDGGVYVCGHGMPTCDVASYCFSHVQKYDPFGNLKWNCIFWDTLCYSYKINGIGTNLADELYISYEDTHGDHIYTVNSNGTITDTIHININNISGFVDISGFHITGFNANTLYGFDNNGNTVSNIQFSTDIQSVGERNDTIYLLTTDSIFIINNNLQIIDGTNISGYDGFSNIKLKNNYIMLISNDGNQQHILYLDYQLQLIKSQIINLKIDPLSCADISEYHFSAGIKFALSNKYSVRLVDYSLESNTDTIIDNCDVGVIDIIANQVSFGQHYTIPDVYDKNVDISVILKNFGTNTATECRINSFITWGICNEMFFTHNYTGINLAPNDSMQIDLGWLGVTTDYYPNQGDSVFRNVCVFSSNPNSYVDTNVVNDMTCENIFMGITDIQHIEANTIKIYPNPATEKVSISGELLGSVELLNIHGKNLFSAQVNSTYYELDLSQFSKGVYLLKLISDKKTRIEKIILK